MFQGGGVCKWGDYNLHGGIYYGDLIPWHQLAHKDDIVTHNGHSSIRLDGPRTSYNWGREINHNWIKVKPGDHIVFRAYIKTEGCNYGWGGSIGVDLYSSNGRLWEVHKREPQSGIWNLPHTGVFVTVPYNRDWTLYTLEFDIPTTPFTRTDDGTPVNPPAYVAGLIPWLGASHNNDNTDNGSVWFADAEFYINP
jgi:hypothetical protein